MTETIVAIWRQALKREEIAPDANFFDTNGNSLLLVHMLKELRATVGPELQLVDLFQHMTVNGLAGQLEKGTEEMAENDMKSAAERRRAMRRQRARPARRLEGRNVMRTTMRRYAGPADLRAMRDLTQRLWSSANTHHVGDLAWGRFMLSPEAADWPIALWEADGRVPGVGLGRAARRPADAGGPGLPRAGP
ncbi:phosphopantetheine-binding protein [Streptomyces violaceusniger]|uniref:phosphopantetheine-binding protein n=1 Tax=Streptomyces violaceusniger TaxID=68280 RepID=UPI00138730B5